MVEGGLPHPESAGAAALADLVTITMGGSDPAWHYRLAVDGRMGMPPEPIAMPSGDSLISLGAYHRYDGVSVEVLGAVPKREVDPASFLDASPLIADLARMSARREASESGERGDVLLMNQASAVRLFAARWGHRLFVIKCTSPIDLYPSVAEAFAGTIASFEPVEPSGRFCEPVSKHGAGGPVAWHCLVPDSWRVDQGGESDEASSFQAVNLRDRIGDDGEVVGRLVVAVFARAAAGKPRDVAEQFLGALADGGLRVLSEEFAAEPVEEPFDRSWLLVSEVTRQDALPGEVRCRVLRHPAAWSLVGTLSPRAEDDRPAWMENKRALDIATSTLKIKAGGTT